ncbi:hypothetical protein Bca52824_092987 [Brassica carinata]|uniref:MATH domain-containing protein n=1 Tax=Brassica carinata TaxID=52824 RepID=A0A8X7P8B8_BRACI|nr:hypothetical protein Bca52824_092987 [Brassica carinata]
MSNQKPSFRYEIDNFSEKKAYVIYSDTFKSGGCEWYLAIYPKGDRLADGHLSLYLDVANSTTLQTGWKKSINYYFVLLNQSGEELYRSASGVNVLFSAEKRGWGYRNLLPLSKFQEKEFLEKDKLIIEVYINGGEVEDNLALKFDEVTIGRKIWDDDKESRAQKVEERVKNLELKLDAVSFKKSLSDEANEYRAQQVEERVKDLEILDVGFELASLNIKLDDLERKKTDDQRVKNLARMELRLTTMLCDLERKKTYDTSVFDSRIKQIEEHVMGLRFKLESLITKLGEISNEKKKADDADGSLVQQLEESVKNIELMVSHLKVEVDKKKNKSSADDGFLLVD